MAPPSPVRVDDSSRGLESGVRRNDGCGRLTSIFVPMTALRCAHNELVLLEYRQTLHGHEDAYASRLPRNSLD